MNKNNLETYLDYYLGLDAPGFAVLVTGEWGSGKTFQVMKAVPLKVQCHVSLFGISNSDEIYNTIFAKMFPGRNFAKKALEITKDISGEMNGVTLGASSLVGNLLGPLIKQTVDKEKVVIFDDLERCPMLTQEILGVINQYVEHHQCKVIILAHDEKTHGDFTKTKEKIIGHTIRIEPKIDDAAAVFFSEKFKLNNFMAIKPIITEAFKKTNCKSLRILKYIINDCSRLLDCLEPIYLKNTTAMNALFNFFCIVSIENKMGMITTSDIKDIPDDYYPFTSTEQNDEIDEDTKNKINFYKKYTDMDLRSGILDFSLTAKIIETGYYPKNEILKSLGESRFFLQQFDTPPWLIIINFDNQNSTVVREAIHEMFEKIRTLAITDIGEILHSFCLSYLLSEELEINKTFDELLIIQKNYIDSLLHNNLLLPESLLYDPFNNDIYENSHSHSYWIKDSYREYFNEIVAHLQDCRKKAKIKRYPLYAEKLLNALDSDLEIFKKLLIGDASESGLFSNIDIMNSIEPDDFIIHWLLLPVESWSKVQSILNARYRRAPHTIVANEKLWLQKIIVSLTLEAELYKGLDSTRIKRLIPYRALASISV